MRRIGIILIVVGLTLLLFSAIGVGLDGMRTAPSEGASESIPYIGIVALQVGIILLVLSKNREDRSTLFDG